MTLRDRSQVTYAPIELEPELMKSFTFKVPSPDGTIFVIIGEHKKKPYLVQIMIGKSGSSVIAWANSLSRMITMALQSGVELSNIIEEISGITSDRIRRYGDGISIRSGPEGVAHALYLYMRGEK